MMKQTKLAVLISALLWGAAASAMTASPIAADQQFARESGVRLNGATVIARHGADDATDPFDDHGADLFPNGATTIAKHGADDAADPFDDHGADLFPNGATTIAKHGADDAADPCDDHGSDTCRSAA